MRIASEHKPYIVGIGGTTRAGSSSELAVSAVLRHSRKLGARTRHFAGGDLLLPPYDPAGANHSNEARSLIDAVRRADALVIASPGYHGSVSGVVKNALDYLEELRGAERPYLEGRAVGCIACAAGWQATVTTLGALRAITHALRGWPTPLGIAANSKDKLFDASGECIDVRLDRNLRLLASQLVEFAWMHTKHDDGLQECTAANCSA